MPCACRVAKLPRLSKSRRDASASSKADSFGLKVRDFIRALTEVQPRDPPKEKSLQENSLATPQVALGIARVRAMLRELYPLAQGGTRLGRQPQFEIKIHAAVIIQLLANAARSFRENCIGKFAPTKNTSTN